MNYELFASENIGRSHPVTPKTELFEIEMILNKTFIQNKWLSIGDDELSMESILWTMFIEYLKRERTTFTRFWKFKI